MHHKIIAVHAVDGASCNQKFDFTYLVSWIFSCYVCPVIPELEVQVLCHVRDLEVHIAILVIG